MQDAPSAVEPHRLLAPALAACLFFTALAFLPSPSLRGVSYAPIKHGVLALGVLVVAVALARTSPVRWDRVDFLLAAAFGLAVLSAIVSSRSLRVSAAALGLDLAGLLCFAGASRLDGRRRAALLWVAVVAAAAIAAIALVEIGGVRFPWAALRRPVSTIGNRNFVAAYLAIALPFAIREVFARRRLAIAAVLSIVVVIAAVRCRSAWIGLAVCAAFAAWLAAAHASQHRARAAAIALLVIGALAGAAFAARFPGLRWREASPVVASLRGLARFDAGSAARRLEHYRLGAAVVRDHPWLGVGPHQWSTAVPRHAHLIPGGHVAHFTGELTPSSEVVRRAAELGLPACILALTALGFAIVGGIRGARTREARISTMACVTALIVAAINALTDAPLFRPESMVLVAVIAGCLRPEPAGGERRSRISSAAVIAAGAAAAATGLAQAVAAVLLLSYGLAATPAALAWYPNPRDVERYARALVDADRCEDAERWLARARAWSPERPGLILIEAKCRARAGRLEEAERLEAEAQRIEPHATKKR